MLRTVQQSWKWHGLWWLLGPNVRNSCPKTPDGLRVKPLPDLLSRPAWRESPLVYGRTFQLQMPLRTSIGAGAGADSNECWPSTPQPRCYKHCACSAATVDDRTFVEMGVVVLQVLRIQSPSAVLGRHGPARPLLQDFADVVPCTITRMDPSATTGSNQ